MLEVQGSGMPQISQVTLIISPGGPPLFFFGQWIGLVLSGKAVKLFARLIAAYWLWVVCILWSCHCNDLPGHLIGTGCDFFFFLPMAESWVAGSSMLSWINFSMYTAYIHICFKTWCISYILLPCVWYDVYVFVCGICTWGNLVCTCQG